MKVFLSWSGSHSHETAKALRLWLPRVIQSVEPFLSSGDIDAGTRWDEEIRQQLLTGRAGILCLDPDNLDSPWIHYEAGALSKTVEKTMVIPYLSGVRMGDLNKPLSAFNACLDDENGTRHLLQSINKGSAQPLSEAILADAFAKQWGDLRKMLDEIPSPTKQVPEKTDRELLERDWRQLEIPISDN